MILSDALIEEIFHVLKKLPWDSVAPLITKLQCEIAQQQRQQEDATQLDSDVRRHQGKR